MLYKYNAKKRCEKMNEDKCEIVCDEINSFLSFENKKWIEKSKFVKLLE
jgi:hypothetical protein